MQIVIKIDDRLYNRIKYLEPKADTMLDRLMRIIQNGTPLPANPTNGDVIKTMFPDFCHLKGLTDYKEIVLFELKDLKDWWNASYKEGENENDN